MENSEIASLISELSSSADDASELVKGLLQASINAGLKAEGLTPGKWIRRGLAMLLWSV